MALEIVSFKPEYAPKFRDLNLAWIEKYFQVEPMDVYLLENCQASIIDPGGFIFFAKFSGTIVGCFAFLPQKDDSYELGKMAVDPDFQGLQIGQTLMAFAIKFAKDKGWKKITLYSSRKLDTALHIYKKYGFREAILEKDLSYARSDIKMELELEN